MSFTQVLKSLTKLVAVACIFLIMTACTKEQPAQQVEAPKEQIIAHTPTETETDFVKLEMVDGGVMIIELYPEKAPKTVENFKKLVSDGFYNGLIFHRVEKDFVIQTGDPTGLGTGGSEETIEGEFAMNGFLNDIKHERGVISMARLSTNYDSASSQFFICHQDCRNSLDGRYAAFGKIISGFETLDRIANVKTNASNRPISEQKISSIKFVNIVQ